MLKQVHRQLLFVALLCALAPLSAQAQVINCPSGFSSSGECGVSLIGAGGEPFAIVGAQNGSSPGLSGSQVLLVPNGAVHVGLSLDYQTQVNVQAFTASFTFVPNGWNISFILNNSTNNPWGFNGRVFAAGAGCEADFFQGFSQPAPPNNVFALELDSMSPLTVSGPFTYSSAQVYQSGQSPCLPNLGGTDFTYVPIDKIGTSPVPLDSPANAQGTSTGDTYSATITYDGSNLTLNLYDVTAGGSCPGPKCFTNTWTDVDIPSIVGSDLAWLGFGGGTNQGSSYPLYVNSVVYNEGTSTSAPTATSTPASKPTPASMPTPASTPAPAATSTPSSTPACSPVYNAPDNGSISGSVPVSITANCNAAASACGYFFRNYLPDGTTSDTQGPSWTLNTTHYANGASGVGVQIYNLGCGSFPGQTVFGERIDSFTIAN